MSVSAILVGKQNNLNQRQQLWRIF